MLRHFSRRFSSSAKGFSVEGGKDYYGILGVSKTSDQQQIRLAFFNLAKKYHPDLNTDKRKEDYEQSKIKFQEINEAYQILTDDELKKRYDDLTGNFFSRDKAEKKEEPRDFNSYYQSFFEVKKQRSYEDERKARYDLDENLRKLAEIKLKREKDMNERREIVNRKKQELLTEIFFRQEMRKLQDQQG